jgi:NAD+ synthase (glutamine-hydrolysing)
MAKVRLALVQTNPVVGAISSNLADCLNWVSKAHAHGADIVLFGEMSATGYPIEDLATRSGFVQQAQNSIDDFARQLQAAGFGEMHVVIGHPAMAPTQSQGHWAIANNCASVLHKGRVLARYAKHHLPNYGVFDEFRVFVPGNEACTFEVNGVICSLLICEDIWQSGGPVAQLAANKTDLTLVLNGSPFELEKQSTRLELVSDLAQASHTAVAYVNLVGGQDDLVFDGNSLLVDSSGSLKATGAAFESDMKLATVESDGKVTDDHPAATPTHANSQDDLAAVWNCLTLGLGDYVRKNGFKSVVLGLSGGIDSAVCAAIAVDSIGKDAVFGVSLPSVYSSDHSKSDAFDLAERLGMAIRTESIAEIVAVTEEQLGLTDLSAENLQARVRGLILMALSNKEGHLTLTTGNKTELAVGYSTIYGDSVGGFAPIKDVPKTMVWALAEWRNAKAREAGEIEPIPQNSISKPPSAELRPGQVDQDSLPPYDQLDALLALYIDGRRSREEIIAAGFEATVVDKIASLVSISEWKRRQGAIGPKISGMSFGRDRRMPITNKFR